MSFQSLTVRPVAGALGAEIEGLDLSRPLGNAAAVELRQAFTRMASREVRGKLVLTNT